MKKYIEAAKATEKLSNTAGIPIHELVDLFIKNPDTEVKEILHGKWEYDDGMDLFCSVCGELAMTLCYETVQYRSRYCPSCGAVMNGGEKP